MRNANILILVAFVLVLSSHVAYMGLFAAPAESQWIKPDESNWVVTYMQNGDYFIGLSYGLAMAFAVYALLKYAGDRKKGITGLFSGLTLTGLIYFGACFLSGCCGSPMIAVYVSLLGPSFQGAGKPITMALTIVSVSVGYFILEKRKTACGGKNDCKKC
jgi:hypothetical protein